MPGPWILVTPASRGIGFALTRRLLRTTQLPVVASSRSDQDKVKAKILEGLDVDQGRLDVLPLDVTDESTISSAASFCKEKFSSSYLHLAYCIPGILRPEKSPGQIDYDLALDMFKTNALGPLMLMKHFVPFLPSRRTELLDTSSNSSLPTLATFAMMSARVGSISDNKLGGWYSYRSSKAAVLQAAKTLNIYLQMSSGGKAISAALHPGTVKTGLSEDFWNSTPKEKLFEPDYAAERLIDVVSKLKNEQGGKTWDWKGEEIPP